MNTDLTDFYDWIKTETGIKEEELYKVFNYGLGMLIIVNPNLYENGKVCLSILGTWSGPGWTTACTLSSVLLSIQSLLNENPIHNEPGWENENGEKIIKRLRC